MESEKTITKRPRGRPRLTDDQRSIRQRESQEQNIIRLRLLRQNNPDIICRYSKKYYENHKEILMQKRAQMSALYHMYKCGKLNKYSIS